MFTKIIGDVHEKAGFLTSLKSEFNLSQDSTFYIGDTSGDVEAGKEAMVKTIGISWGFQHKSILAKSNPDFLIDNLTEIEKILGP
jgi:pyrophosphatase PpaX